MFARVVTIFLALLVAACGDHDARAPFTDSRIPPSLAAADWPPEGWTWGLVRSGDAPPQRYGMAGPDAVPRGQTLILPGYGEAAEDYYRLARALTARGYVVWVLDGAGQGGSGRISGTRDLGHLDDFEGDIANIGAMIDKALPSDTPGPVILVASSSAGDLALRRLQRGANVTGLVLLAPTRRAPTTGANLPTRNNVLWARRLLLGRLRAHGQAGWSSVGPHREPGLAPQTYQAWRQANPDLRMGGPSYDWLAAFEDLQAQVNRDGLGGVRAPSLILGSTDSPKTDSDLRDRLCRGLPRCFQRAFSGQDDADRQIVSFVETLTVQGLVTPGAHSLPKARAGD
ncbi:MAG TPA: alpha/beta hydrolase [Caulobacteraceae bacterium]|jgi:lysophospholipase